MVHISTYYFFVGFGLMGLLDADFFEKNMFLTIIGTLIGIVLMLSMFIYSISMLPSIKPFKTITNFIKISHIFIFVFLINYVLPDDTTLIERFEIRWVIFIVLGVYVIISNIFMVINEKSNDKTILHMKWEKAIQKIEVPSINAYEAKLIFYIGIAAILILSFIDINLRIASNYSVLIVINIFIIVRYIAIFKTSKKINYIIIFTSLSLTIISVSLFIAFTDFINSQSLLKIILTMLPSLYLYPKIIKSYYPFLWKEIYEINIKQ
jgi:hypothetical protein